MGVLDRVAEAKAEAQCDFHELAPKSSSSSPEVAPPPSGTGQGTGAGPVLRGSQALNESYGKATARPCTAPGSQGPL